MKISLWRSTDGLVKRMLAWFTSSRRNAILGCGFLIAVVFVTYYPAFRIGLAADDLLHVANAAKLTPYAYLTRFVDARTPMPLGWYRPVFILLIGIEYFFFGVDPLGYHIIVILLHVVNVWLLFGLVWRFSWNWRIAFVSAIAYSGLAIYSENVVTFNTPDPLMTIFYLLAIWSWSYYLLKGARSGFLLTLLCVSLALGTKESAVVLPAVLFLEERFLLRIETKPATLFRRYLIFVLLLIPYLAIEFHIPHPSIGIGFHIVTSAIEYLSALVLPFQVDSVFDYIALGIAGLLFLIAVIRTQSLQLIFLFLVGCLAILPMVGFRLITFTPRYLYLASMASAIFFALSLEFGKRAIHWGRWYNPTVSLGLALFLLLNSLGINQAATGYDSYVHSVRAPFRDISQHHPSFPEDTYLYFIDSPHTPLYAWAGLLQLRYGSNVTVGSAVDNSWMHPFVAPATRLPSGGVNPADEVPLANLREHNVAYVYYSDETGKPIEVAVDKIARASTVNSFPVDFQVPIRLEGVEPVNSEVKPGETLVMLLYWRATGIIDKDYTVFAHLVNGNNEIVAGYDSPPQQGRSQTTSWKLNERIVDSIIMPIAPDASSSSQYRLEVGLYNFSTMERIGITNAAGQVATDTVVIGPFSVVE
jgi:Dolichyl-phosphate-mannose-protein mannosyltransferase